MNAAKITGFSIQDFKRIRLVEIHPDENGLTILGGRNAQGKSSCLDAIAYALGGESFRPSDINNHDGEKNAAIRVEIDGLIVERAGKNAALKITDGRGMRGNQTLLNDIVSKFALDLGAFMRATDTDKAKLLLKMFPDLEQKLAELKTQADGIREARADKNRDIKRLQVHFDEMPHFPEAPAEEISIESLAKEMQEVSEAAMTAIAQKNLLEIEKQKAAERENALTTNQQQIDFTQAEFDVNEHNMRDALKQLEAKYAQAKEEIQHKAALIKSDLESRIAELQKNRSAIESQIAETKNGIEKLTAKLAGLPDYAAMKNAITEKMKKADETNLQIRANSEKRKLYDQISEMRKLADGQTAELQSIEASRTALLQNAKLPLPELSITEDGELLYRGQKWDCMSGSERLKVATAICMKSKPGCGFVLIDGLEAMDPQTLAEFAEFLTEQNMQAIGTIVGENAATVIIEDGRVQEKENTPTTTDTIQNQKCEPVTNPKEEN